MVRILNFVIDACPVGTFSTTGTPPCSPCMPGTYADNYGSIQCTQCDSGMTTYSFGASNVSECAGLSSCFIIYCI